MVCAFGFSSISLGLFIPQLGLSVSLTSFSSMGGSGLGCSLNPFARLCLVVDVQKCAIYMVWIEFLLMYLVELAQNL